MFRYDSTHGQFAGEVSTDGDKLCINGKKVNVYSCMNPAEIPWGKHEVDFVVESTGVFTTLGKAEAHITGTE